MTQVWHVSVAETRRQLKRGMKHPTRTQQPVNKRVDYQPRASNAKKSVGMARGEMACRSNSWSGAYTTTPDSRQGVTPPPGGATQYPK